MRFVEGQTVSSDKLKRAYETVGVLEQRLAASHETTGGDGPVGTEEILDGEGRDQITSVLSGLTGSEGVATLEERGGAPVDSNNLYVSRHQADADPSLNTNAEHEDLSRQPRYERKALDSQLSPSPTSPLREMPERAGVDGVETVMTSVSLCHGGVSDRLLRPEAALHGDCEDAQTASRELVGADAGSARQRITMPPDTTVDAVLGRGILRSREDAGLVGQDVKLGETISFEGRPAGAISPSQRASSFSKAFVEDVIQSAYPSREVMAVADPRNARRARGYSSDVEPPIDVDDNAGDRNGNPEERENFDAIDMERHPFFKDVSAGDIASVKLVSSPRIEGSDRRNTGYVGGGSSNNRSSGSWTCRSTDSPSAEQTQSSSTDSQSSEQTQSLEQTAAALSSGRGERAGSVGISRQSSRSAVNSRHSTSEAALDQRRSVNDEQPNGEGHLAPSVSGSRLGKSMLRTETLTGEAVEAANSDVLADRQVVEVEGGPGDDVDNVGASAQSTRSSASLHLPTPTALGTQSPLSEKRSECWRSSGSRPEGSEDGPGVNYTPDSSVRVRE